MFTSGYEKSSYGIYLILSGTFALFAGIFFYVTIPGILEPEHYVAVTEASPKSVEQQVVYSAPVALGPKPEWLFQTEAVSINDPIPDVIVVKADISQNSANNLENTSAVFAYSLKANSFTSAQLNTLSSTSKVKKTLAVKSVSKDSQVFSKVPKVNNVTKVSTTTNSRQKESTTSTGIIPVNTNTGIASFQSVPSTANYINPVTNTIDTTIAPSAPVVFDFTPTPTPTPDTLATVSPTATPTVLAALVTTPTPIPVATPTPPVVTQVPSPTPAPVIATPTSQPTPTPTIRPSTTPTPTPIPTTVPTIIPTPTLTPIPTVVPTQTPTSVPTKLPTPTPTQVVVPVPVNTSQNYKFGISLGQSLLAVSRTEMISRLDDMVSLGVGWIRFDIDWASVQPKNSSSFDWVGLDALIAAANARNIKMLPILDFTAPWARPAGCTNTNKCAPRDPAEFAAFAAEVVKRYAPQGIHDWEIWNEPNTKFFWQPLADAGAYVDLVKATYTAIKNVDPGANVIAGSMAPAATADGNISPYEFLNQIYQNGGKDYFDSVSFHPYSFPVLASYSAPWNAWQQMFAGSSLRSLMSANGDDAKRIWITEFGAPTGGPGALADVGNYNLSQSPDHVTEDLQTQMFTDSFSLFNSYTWAGPMFWYSYKDLGTTNDTIENFFGIIRFDGTLKPIYGVMKDVLHQ